MTFSNLVSSRYFGIVVESIVTLLVLLIGFARPSVGERAFRVFEKAIQSVATRTRTAILLVIVSALLCRAVILPFIPVPNPSVHDEFSYLLAGKTFAAGRLTNPPHQFWEHFESIHILQQPTYMSMYPPAQGMFLAIGKVIFGVPWMGVWLSTLLMAGFMCWMLQAWLPPSWALVGALLYVVRWCLFSYWVNSYWGGAVPALAGAMILGGLPRLLRHPALGPSLILGTGVVLLAYSRPYEGLIFTITTASILVICVYRRHLFGRILTVGTVLPLSAILLLGSALLLYYNWRVTGDALLFPYLADRQQYATSPLFLCGSLRPEPRYTTPRMRRVYDDEARLFIRERAALGIPEAFRKLKDFWIFYLGPLLTIPIISVCARNSREFRTQVRLAAVLVLALVIAVLPEVWFYPHYTAPAMSALVLLVMGGLKRLRCWKWKGRKTGLFLSRAIPGACALMCLIPLSAASLGARLDYWPLAWYGGNPDIVRPPSLTESLRLKKQKALIFVRYSANSPVGDEWVYNDPDIDRSPIVWSREINRASDAALIRYFRDRTVWLLEVDRRPWKLVPYDSN